MREGGRKEGRREDSSISLPAALIKYGSRNKKVCPKKFVLYLKSLKWRFEIKTNGKLYIQMHLTVMLQPVWFYIIDAKSILPILLRGSESQAN